MSFWLILVFSKVYRTPQAMYVHVYQVQAFSVSPKYLYNTRSFTHILLLYISPYLNLNSAAATTTSSTIICFPLRAIELANYYHID